MAPGVRARGKWVNTTRTKVHAPSCMAAMGHTPIPTSPPERGGGGGTPMARNGRLTTRIILYAVCMYTGTNSRGGGKGQSYCVTPLSQESRENGTKQPSKEKKEKQLVDPVTLPTAWVLPTLGIEPGTSHFGCRQTGRKTTFPP